MTDYGLVITRVVHDRHHASRRNPYNEVECSDHYTRAMASHGSFIAACGLEYNGPEGHLGFAPRIKPDSFKAPFTAAEGWGTFEQTREQSKLAARVRLRYGQLTLNTVSLAMRPGISPGTAAVRLNGDLVQATLQVAEERAVVRFSEPYTLRAGEELEVVLNT